MKLIWSLEANKECESVMNSKTFFVSPNGENVRTIKYEVYQTFYDMTREPYTTSRHLGNDVKEQLLAKDHTYGELVCKCENITKGDILFALNRPLKICSVDGIKRRVRAGMGRCQGGFCSLPVAEIIAKARKVSIEKVLKENKNSNLFVYQIRGGENNGNL